MSRVQSPLAVLNQNVHPDDIAEALVDLTLSMGDSAELREFIELFQKYDGDMTALLAKTHEPVSIEEFVESDFFLKLRIVDDVKEDKGGGLWRPVYDAIKEIIAGGYVESLFCGAIGTGKTSAAQVVTAYKLYLMSCQVSPHLKFNILPKNDIYWVMLNKSDDLAYKVTFKGFKGLIENSPYFNEVFPFDKNLESMLRFPKKIVVHPFAAFSGKIMGMDVMGGIVDEMNFMQHVEKSKRTQDRGEFDQAKAIYGGLVRRLKSRFDVEDPTVPSGICLVSSKSHYGDFTENRQMEAEQENAERVANGERPLTYIYDKAQWEARPDPSFKVGIPFQVEVGEGRWPTRVLMPNDLPREKARIVTVPRKFWVDFQRDPEKSLADYVGAVAGGLNAFMYDKVKIWAMDDIWQELGYPTPLLKNEIFSTDPLDVNPDYKVPNPHLPRAAHIDLAYAQDAVGIAIGHVHKVSSGKVRDPSTGAESIEEFPHVAYDQVLVVKPPRAGQIELAEMRSIIYFLRDVMKIPIRWVTYDGFQSIDSRQILRKQGFKTDYVSVEHRDTYMPFRTAMFYHKRIACQLHERVFKELSLVQEDQKDGKIDHPSGGSKDGADAMVGMFTMLMKTPSSWKPELRDFVDARPLKDRLTDDEKKILGEFIDKDPPAGSLMDKIKRNLSNGQKKQRRTIRRRSLRNNDSNLRE